MMPTGSKLDTQNALASPQCYYNSRLQKGGALLEDMRLLVRSWDDRGSESHVDAAVAENLLGKNTRARSFDTFRYAFLPRFVDGSPRDAWKIVRQLEDRAMPVDILRPVYYWITARNERILYDFVCAELTRQSMHQGQAVTAHDVSVWLRVQLARCGKRWSDSVTIRVALGILAALRDFGILEGASKKRIAPAYIPIESFAYIAFAMSKEGGSGAALVSHNDWRLFLFAPPVVERMFLEADRNGLLRFQTAGRIARIDFLAKDFEEMADVVAARAH